MCLTYTEPRDKLGWGGAEGQISRWGMGICPPSEPGVGRGPRSVPQT